MKHKLFGILISVSIFAVLIFELISWRSDYPFTKWGMYSTLMPFAPYFDINIEVDPGRNLEEMVKDPWDLREFLWPLAGLGSRRDNIEFGLATYTRMVEQAYPQNREKIRKLLEEQVWHSEDLAHIRVVFYGWHVLTYENTGKPDVRIVLYTESPSS